MKHDPRYKVHLLFQTHLITLFGGLRYYELHTSGPCVDFYFSVLPVLSLCMSMYVKKRHDISTFSILKS